MFLSHVVHRAAIPRHWPRHVQQAILHAISLAEVTLAHARGWAANNINQRLRLKAELDEALAVMDHFSRRVVGLRVFKRPPASLQIRHFLGQLVRRVGQSPRRLVCDKGSQFWRRGFKAWCKQRRIRPRFSAPILFTDQHIEIERYNLK